MNTPGTDFFKTLQSSGHASDSQATRSAEQGTEPPKLTPISALNMSSRGGLDHIPSPHPVRSSSRARGEKHRWDDDLEFEKAERVASRVSQSSSRAIPDLSRSKSRRNRSKSREVGCLSTIEVISLTWLIA